MDADLQLLRYLEPALSAALEKSVHSLAALVDKRLRKKTQLLRDEYKRRMSSAPPMALTFFQGGRTQPAELEKQESSGRSSTERPVVRAPP